MSNLTRILPRALQKRLRDFAGRESRKERERQEMEIPQVHLAEQHVANCELLLNRSTLISRLKKGGIVAELGVDRGDFSEHILEAAEPAVLHLVDVWGSERYHDGLFESVKARFRDELASGRVQIHRKLSTAAAADFEPRYFDWIYIDTDHAYEITREELRKFAPTVKPDGVIAGHDYSMGNWVKSYRYGVIEAVHEFCVEDGWELIYLTLDPIERQSFAIRRIGRRDEGSD